MDYYVIGKQKLDDLAFGEARAAFLEGAGRKDARCWYGLLAVDAMEGLDRCSAIAGLQQVWEQLLKLADDGDGDGCFIVGRCYETGSVVEVDIPLAMKYYTKGAAKGNLDAMFNLGCIYMQMGNSGAAIAKDYFWDAAKRGHFDAKRALEHMMQG